jgi:hypothetical protein
MSDVAVLAALFAAVLGLLTLTLIGALAFSIAGDESRRRRRVDANAAEFNRRAACLPDIDAKQPKVLAAKEPQISRGIRLISLETPDE